MLTEYISIIQNIPAFFSLKTFIHQNVSRLFLSRFEKWLSEIFLMQVNTVISTVKSPGIANHQFTSENKTSVINKPHKDSMVLSSFTDSEYLD